MKKKLILSLGLAALLTSCGYSEDYDEMEYLTGPDDSCADKCGIDQYCINGVCSNKQPGGNECYDHNHCQSGFCADFNRKTQDYIGVCKSYGGQSCRIDSDCIDGKCNNGICECRSHNGCEGKALCDNGTCLPLVSCPSDASKSCILIHDTVPNSSWASSATVSASANDPYFGNMIGFSLPTRHAYSCGMLSIQLLAQYLGISTATAPDLIASFSQQLDAIEQCLKTPDDIENCKAGNIQFDSIDEALTTFDNLVKRFSTLNTFFKQLTDRMKPSCFSMDLENIITGTENSNKKYEEFLKEYPSFSMENPVAYLEYVFTPNGNFLDNDILVKSSDGKYSLFFKAYVDNSNLVDSSYRFQMSIGDCDNYNYIDNSCSADQNAGLKGYLTMSSVTFPVDKSTELSMKLSEKDGKYRVYFKGATSADNFPVDEMLSLYCDNNYRPNVIKKIQVDSDTKTSFYPPIYEQMAVSCKTTKFALTSLKVYAEVNEKNIKKDDPKEKNNQSSNRQD